MMKFVTFLILCSLMSADSNLNKDMLVLTGTYYDMKNPMAFNNDIDIDEC